MNNLRYHFPPGSAILVLLVAGLFAGLLVVNSRLQMSRLPEPDLEFVFSALNHYEDYEVAIKAFERKHDVRIAMHLVNLESMKSRLQSALMSGIRMPDLVEIESRMFGALIQGPLEGIGFHDLTKRIEEEELRDEFPAARLAMWSREGRIFGIPHDVHPVMLAYRADILQQIGIDPEALDTWETFAKVARERIVKDLDGDGTIDRYAIDFALDGFPELTSVLMPQLGIETIDASGRPGFNREKTVELIAWFARQVQGPERISFPAGWGQNLAKALNDGLIVFLMTPDWRTKQVEMDNPRLAGQLRLMPLPAWEEGGRRTSTMGGSSLVIPKTAANPELAWELAKFLYLEKEHQPQRFRHTNIISPARSSWGEPFLDEVNPFWEQPIGRLYVNLADEVPAVHPSPYSEYVRTQISTAFTRVLGWKRRNPGGDPRPYIREQLTEAESNVLRRLERNVFLSNPVSGGEKR